MRIIARFFSALLLLCLFAAPSAGGYSLLTHEQLIDLTWDASVVPLLKSRYPTLTDAQIEQARAYAYGGCVIQDIGYYPFGDQFFSDLTHYVRSGDFVVALFRNATNANELAFAVGALSHYIGDSIGHADATNLAVPVEFPKLGQRYGHSVNYAQGESQHIRTEFAFDINEISHARFAPVHYLRHIGLEVPQRQLALAFYQTYGLTDHVTAERGRNRINVKGYRFAVRNFIPRVAYAVTLLHRHNEPPVVDSPDLQRLTSELSAVAAKNHWDTYRKNAGIGTYTLAGLLFVLPRVGPLTFVAVKGPHADTDSQYVHSLLRSADALNFSLRRFTPPAASPSVEHAVLRDARPQPSPSDPLPAIPVAQALQHGASDPRHPLRNRDLDTGVPVRPAGYRLTDVTYCRLVHRLAAKSAQPIPPGIKEDVLAYYADMNLNFATKKNPKDWQTLQADLATLRTMKTSDEPVPFPTYGSEEGDPDENTTR